MMLTPHVACYSRPPPAEQAKTSLGCNLPKFYIDLDIHPSAGRVKEENLYLLGEGATTTAGVKLHYIPTADFITATKVCPHCFKFGCYCLNKEERANKRKTTATARDGKKKAHLAHLEATLR